MKFSVENVGFSYDGKRDVLEDVCFDLESGDILCLLGSNGTGKTTLLRCILGFHQPQRGSICIDGTDLVRVHKAKRARHMAYVPQSSSIAFPYTVKEVVLMGRISHMRLGSRPRALDHRIAEEALERLQIEGLADRRFPELSGGERQMVLVARALAQQAEVLVMDEPTSNLDYHNQVRILTAIKHLSSQGIGILMTSHYPDHAFLACSKVALMGKGKIVAKGDPDEIVTSKSLSSLYDTPVVVARAESGSLKIKTCIPLLDEEQVRQAAEVSRTP